MWDTVLCRGMSQIFRWMDFNPTVFSALQTLTEVQLDGERGGTGVETRPERSRMTHWRPAEA